jgi:hypothetical protein
LKDFQENKFFHVIFKSLDLHQPATGKTQSWGSSFLYMPTRPVMQQILRRYTWIIDAQDEMPKMSFHNT